MKLYKEQADSKIKYLERLKVALRGFADCPSTRAEIASPQGDARQSL